MFIGFGNLTTIEWVVVIAVGLVIFGVPLIGALLAIRVFNNFETQRRSEIVDQALTRDEDITPLPAADEPSATPRA